VTVDNDRRNLDSRGRESLSLDRNLLGPLRRIVLTAILEDCACGGL
jgi:hypothetical protein